MKCLFGDNTFAGLTNCCAFETELKKAFTVNTVKLTFCGSPNYVQDIKTEKITENGLTISGITFNNGDTYFDVIVHGNLNTFNVILETASGKQTFSVSAATLANEIKNKLPTTNTKLIRLLSCSNLESAKELSLALGREVVATEGGVTLCKDGSVESSTDEWYKLTGCTQEAIPQNITNSWKPKANMNECVEMWEDDEMGHQNGATATVTAGKHSEKIRSGGGHSEIKSLEKMRDAGQLKGQDVVISDVVGHFSNTGYENVTIGVCAKCRYNMFDPLIDGEANSITLTETRNNTEGDSITIYKEDFEIVKQELSEVFKNFKGNKNISDNSWAVLKKYAK